QRGRWRRTARARRRWQRPAWPARTRRPARRRAARRARRRRLVRRGRGADAHRMIRVLLVDAQPLVRAGLRRIVSGREGFDVVGECEDGAQVPATVDDTAPDLVVMDIRMKGVDGVEATRRLRERADAPPVLVLTTFDDDEVLSAALRAGAAGFQLKDAPGEELIRAIRTVSSGEAWLDPGVTERVLQTYRSSAPTAKEISDRVGELTQREAEVLQ